MHVNINKKVCAFFPVHLSFIGLICRPLVLNIRESRKSFPSLMRFAREACLSINTSFTGLAMVIVTSTLGLFHQGTRDDYSLALSTTFASSTPCSNADLPTCLPQAPINDPSNFKSRHLLLITDQKEVRGVSSAGFPGNQRSHLTSLPP